MSDNNKYSVPYLSLVLLLYGYVYLRTYYAAFGIQVHYYFSIEDYIRANIDNIYRTIVPFSISILLGAILSKSYQLNNLNERLEALRAEIKDKQEPSIEKLKDIETITEKIASLRSKQIIDKKWESWNEILGIFGFGMISILMTYVRKDPQRYIFYFFTIAWIWIAIGHKLIPQSIRYIIIKLNYFSVMMIMTIIYVFGWLYVSAKYESAKIIELKTDGNTEVFLLKDYTDKYNIETKALVVIGVNSKYYFMYNNKTNTSYVIPAEQVLGSIIKDDSTTIKQSGHRTNINNIHNSGIMRGVAPALPEITNNALQDNLKK